MMIPTFESIKFVDEKTGFLTDGARQLMIQLFEQLQLNAGQEGLVAPTQPAANITTIQNNQNANGGYTCQYGTIIYNSDSNSVMISINNGFNVPVFKTVTLT